MSSARPPIRPRWPLWPAALLLITQAAGVAADTMASPAPDVVVQAHVDRTAILNNPGRGWETNNRVLSDYQDAALPPSRVAYFKYYLKVFLREDGSIDLSQLSTDLERAQKSGQQVAFRLMIFSEEEGGEILRSFGVTRGRTYRYIDGDFRGPEQWVPDLDDEQTLSVLHRLILALGKRFDGNPSLSHIDIGYAGLWGEWHTSDTVPRVPMPTVETQKRLIDMHFEAFPRTHKLMQLQPVGSLRYALDRGAGLRADCLGGPDTTMMKMYPLTLLAARAQHSWKRAPFAFEICWNLTDWEKRGWDAQKIFANALDYYHPSLINTKSATIPPALRPGFDDMLRRIGYRFAILQLKHPKTVKNTSPLKMSIRYENSGVAPCYSALRFLVQLRSKTSPAQAVFPTEAHLCGKAPGIFEAELSLTLSPALKGGDYEIGLAAAEGDGVTPAIQLANTSSQEGWSWLSTLRVE